MEDCGKERDEWVGGAEEGRKVEGVEELSCRGRGGKKMGYVCKDGGKSGVL